MAHYHSDADSADGDRRPITSFPSVRVRRGGAEEVVRKENIKQRRLF